MAKKTGKIIIGIIVLLLIAISVFYAAYISALKNEEPLSLLVCIDTKPSIISWTCEQALKSSGLKPEQVKRLNEEAGARYPLTLKDEKKAEEILTLFLAKGVDINAGDIRASNLTALHVASVEHDVKKAELLIKHGAKLDVKDANGRTPLDFVRSMQQKHPKENHSEMIQFLEKKTSAAI